MGVWEQKHWGTGPPRNVGPPLTGKCNKGHGRAGRRVTSTVLKGVSHVPESCAGWGSPRSFSPWNTQEGQPPWDMRIDAVGWADACPGIDKTLGRRGGAWF